MGPSRLERQLVTPGVQSPSPGSCHRCQQCRDSSGNTSLPSSFVPPACPYECETGRNSVVQGLRKYPQILGFGLPCIFLRQPTDPKYGRIRPEKREVTGSTPV